jgi:hypothetical protein
VLVGATLALLRWRGTTSVSVNGLATAESFSLLHTEILKFGINNYKVFRKVSFVQATWLSSFWHFR